MFMILMGTVVIAGIVGYLSEKTGFTHNGYLPSIIICVGGAFLLLERLRDETTVVMTTASTNYNKAKELYLQALDIQKETTTRRKTQETHRRLPN